MKPSKTLWNLVKLIELKWNSVKSQLSIVNNSKTTKNPVKKKNSVESHGSGRVHVGGNEWNAVDGKAEKKIFFFNEKKNEEKEERKDEKKKESTQNKLRPTATPNPVKSWE